MEVYEVYSENTRTEVIKNVLYLEVACLGILQSTLLLNAHTYPNDVSTFSLLETILVRFFCDGFQLVLRICLNFRNRLKSSSFECFLRFGNNKKS